MAKRQWSYRPTDKEHELLLRSMREHPEYVSIAQFIREATLRLCYENDRPKLFTHVSELIDILQDAREKFISLVIRGGNE